MPRQEVYLEDDPLWYKDAIIYELHVKAFCDSNGDGIGDFKGLTEKLDYLQDLGITAIWLLPFYPSPLKDDGYDIADYLDIHPDYGTMKDFRDFLREAHKRGLRVITELVLNHTSDQHPWFQKARRAKRNTAARNFYVWSDTPEKFSDARVIFQDFETSNWAWDNMAKAYFWHRFYSHQPDLNFDSPQVRKAIFKVIDYWMKLGVDGVRLDAVPYLYEREGTNCENLPETYEFLKELRDHVDSKFQNRLLLAEANQWPEDAVAYFGHGDECHMAFHFPLMPRIFMALQMEDNYPIVDILDQTPAIPENCQWAMFLRNHDELTLEMVTDEERDYMYQMYAKDPRARINLGIRRRLAPLLDNDKRKIKLMYALLFSLPGSPVLYYGDELSMGDNYHLGDRDGVRTPMQWSSDRNAGFSRANPQRLYLPVIIDPGYHYETTNVETQEWSHSSFLWWMRHFVALRKRHKAFGRGSLQILTPDNPKIFAFIREYEEEKILVVVNLSHHSQVVKLDLEAYAGCMPKEMFSKNKFIPIKEDPYVLTLGPYGWFLFSLEPEVAEAARDAWEDIPQLRVSQHWTRVFQGKRREDLEETVLPQYLLGRRWFGGKARQIQELKIAEIIPVGDEPYLTQVLLVRLAYTEGLPDMYMIPVAFAEEAEAENLLKEQPHAVICWLTVRGKKGVLYDGVYNERFCTKLLSMVARRRRKKATSGEFYTYPGKAYGHAIKGREYLLKPQVLKAEQSNTAILYGNEFFLKIYRHPDEGVNPDLEIARFLTERAGFSHIPLFAGALEYRPGNGRQIDLGVVQSYVPNQGDAWRLYLDIVKGYYDRVLTHRSNIPEIPEVPLSFLDVAESEMSYQLQELLTEVPRELSGLLGKRTGELHLALAADLDDPQFAPEKFSLLFQRSVFQSMQSLAKRTFQLLRNSWKNLPDGARGEAEEVLAMEKKIVDRLRAILNRNKKLAAMKIRTHGDYHLGQVLYTGKDFVIIDFEGEPARPLSERRLKRSPLRDVAGMIRSFHYAAYFALLKETPIRADDIPSLEGWADLWYRCMGADFVKAYLDTVADSGLIPKQREALNIMLDAFLLEKAVYELGYELNNRPEWVIIPLRGIRYLMADQ